MQPEREEGRASAAGRAGNTVATSLLGVVPQAVKAPFMAVEAIKDTQQVDFFVARSTVVSGELGNPHAKAEN